MRPRLKLSLFGTCAVRLQGDTSVNIRGTKHRALFALLATAPMGRRSRSYLQTMLWGESDYDSGHQNLRRALADLRKLMEPAFDSIVHTTTTDVQLDLEQVDFDHGDVSRPFLEDLNLRRPEFLAWRDRIRSAPEQIAALKRAVQGGSGRMRLRISALPLTVPAGTPELRVIADWVAQEICRALSRSKLLTVISHLSGRAMAKRMIDINDVRDTLGVDYIVTGTLRQFQGGLVCDFDLIDVENGSILWNRNLSCAETDFAECMPEHLVDVVKAVGRSIAEASLKRVRNTPLPNIDDHHLWIAGVSAMHRQTLRDFLNARQYLSEAAARARNTAEIHAWLGKWYVLSVSKGYSTDREGDSARALDCTARALDLDPDSSFSLTIDGFAHAHILKDLDVAERRYAAALECNPNESLCWLLRGAMMAFQDRGLAAINAAETARLLSPIDPLGYYYDSLAGSAYLAAGQYEQALALADRSLAANSRHISTLRVKITALHCLGRGEEARQAALDLKRRFPEFQLEDYRRNHPSADQKTGQVVIEALAASGIS